MSRNGPPKENTDCFCEDNQKKTTASDGVFSVFIMALAKEFEIPADFLHRIVNSKEKEADLF
jgi:hypothetical protein